MQASEALQRLIGLVDELHQTFEGDPIPEDDLTAVAVCQAMLNAMIPVARYRAYVEIDPADQQPKRTKEQQKRAVHHEFVISSIPMDGIIAGLVGVTNIPTKCKISVFEQEAQGAKMISGYQGETKCQQYRLWLESLKALETLPTIN